MSGPWERYQGTTPDRAGPWSRYTRRDQAPARQGPDRDRIRAEVAQELEDQRAQGLPVDRGHSLERRIFQGATFGLGDELVAGAMTPFEMISRRTLDPREAFTYAHERERQLLDRSREEGGIAGTVAEIGGSVGSGAGISRAIQAAPQAATAVGRFLQGTFGGARAGQGAVARVGYGTTGGATYGGVVGAAEADPGERVTGARHGATLGGLFGGGLQVGAEGVRAIASPIMARFRPQEYASRQVARAVSESGRSADDIAQSVRQGAADGQPFTVADAIGNPGQRQLSVIARNPGEARTRVVDFLDARQADQGRRISNIVSEGFDAPQTAEQTRAAMRSTLRDTDLVNYEAARQAARPVDLSSTIRSLDDALNRNPILGDSALRATEIGRRLQGVRSQITDGRNQLIDFDTVLNVKQDLGRQIGRMKRQGEAVPDQLATLYRQLDTALENASDAYRLANDTSRQMRNAIDAIDTGRTAAQRGRSEDVIDAFGGLQSDAQQGFRTGYADRLIESAQGGAMGANKARPFTSQAAQTELPALAAPGQGPRMMDRLGRENVMFETRAQAIGGSRTADNLADNAAVAMDPAIIGNLLMGRWGQAGQNALARSGDFLSGSTPEVRQQMANILLQSGGDPNLLREGLARAMESEQFRREIGNALLRGSLAGGAAGASGGQNPRTTTR